MRAPEPPPVTRFLYELPGEQDFDASAHQTVAVSPDGRLFAYGTREGLFLRPIRELDARLIQGTANDNPSEPLFSPDLKWIVYYSLTEQKIKKIPTGGGVPVAICDAPIYGGMNWGPGNTIIYGGAEENSGEQNCMMQVSANGGTPSALFKEQAQAIGRPQMLPGGKSVLFTELNILQGTIICRIMAHSIENGETREITAGYIGRYLPTGHLVYTSGVNIGEWTGTLFAVPFDPGNLEITGEAVPLGEAVSGFLGVRYDISNSGTLAYVFGTPGATTASSAQGFKFTPEWVDRQGKEETLPFEPDTYVNPKISPDGTKIAFSVSSEGNDDIWILDLVRGTRMRLTFEEGEDSWPLWTPDSRQIVYRSAREGTVEYDINRKPADGFGEIEKIVTWPNLPGPFSWSNDGTILLSWDLSISPLKTGISMLSLENGHERVPLIDGRSNEDHPQVSPDGRWLAYDSNESGQHEVYVCPFPEVNKGRWQVSTGGGNGPLWAPNGRELFYRNKESVMAVAVETDQIFKFGKPQTLFQGRYLSVPVTGAILPMWDIHPDGKRFLMIKAPQLTGGESTARASQKIVIVTNWFEELKERVPVE